MKQLWMVSCVNFVKSIVYVFKISRMFLMFKKKIQEIYLKRTFEIQRILLDKGVIARKNRNTLWPCSTKSAQVIFHDCAEAATENGEKREKKVILKISQNSQENTCARVSFLTEHLWWLLLYDQEKSYELIR